MSDSKPCPFCGQHPVNLTDAPWCCRGADEHRENAALRAENARLRAALEEIVKNAATLDAVVLLAAAALRNVSSHFPDTKGKVATPCSVCLTTWTFCDCELKAELAKERNAALAPRTEDK